MVLGRLGPWASHRTQDQGSDVDVDLLRARVPDPALAPWAWINSKRTPRSWTVFPVTSGLGTLKVDVLASDAEPLSQQRITLEAAIPEGLTVLDAGNLGPVRLCQGQQPTHTGDPAFDTYCWVAGPRSYLAAVLDAHTRRKLVAAVGKGLTIQEGGISLTASLHASDVELRQIVTFMESIAQVLRMPSDEPGALLENALKERVEGVGMLAANELWRTYPNSPEARQLDEEGLGSWRVWIAIAVVQRLERQASLDALLAMASDGRKRADFRVRALRALADKGLDDRVATALVALVPRSSGRLFVDLLSVRLTSRFDPRSLC